MKWGMQAFDTFSVVPPGFGIVHQVNLEYLARGVHKSKDGVYYPDTLVGTDSHTTMINGIGVVGWGVGGIEAEAGMLGQPVYFLTPDVVGVRADRPAARRRHRHRPGADRHRDAAQGTRWWASSSSSSARARARWRCPTAPPSPTWRPNTARRWASSRSTSKTIDYFKGTGRTQGRDRGLRGLLQGAGPVRHARRRRDRLQPGASKLDLGSVAPSPGRPEAAAGPHRARQRASQVRRAVQRSRRPTTASTSRPPKLAKRFKTARRPGDRATATC